MAATDWRRYLADFHRDNPGAVQEVLERARSGDHNPYDWLARAVPPSAHRVLDLACGGGAMVRRLASPGRTVVGLDLSAEELDVARRRAPGSYVRADGVRLPFADGSLDAVTSVLGLLVVQPLDEAVREITRVLRPGGALAVIAPSIWLMSPKELADVTRLTRVLRTRPQFPNPVERTGVKALLALLRLHRVEDKREVYFYTVDDREDAERLVRALYLPRSPAERREIAVEHLVHRVAKQGQVRIAVGMRRVVAMK
ncbi:methyltransferase domain-containing protein [Auraticoccus sp. F435]|uniref:Methyltransferase domain-containing protein n=1 Tax=Auraticoccus cholistanensis TaxID=2656650 RepID=A0A6A9V110_9ACTN|nr:class I SAM-dependent methyltransferase [Auraticoccus cholistanensis]MVA76599.1 methyltransferase domain-containing protein [Auraticoccus cholistanensis]